MSDSVITEVSAVLVSDEPAPPDWLAAWLDASGLVVCGTSDASQLLTWVRRGRPRLVVVDAREVACRADRLQLVRQLKADARMALVPLVVLSPAGDVAEALEGGADEVLPVDCTGEEATARLRALVRRSDRDIDVHPSTHLPGARGIEAELQRRIARAEPFAACYADLDHFKEYNDRYGFHRGNAVIGLVAEVLHDAVSGRCGTDGFVGHIGGDDFLYIVPTAAMEDVCDEVMQAFDALAPLQYSEADRRAGYFLGKDRRNQLYRVPLMTLSIGVVTNQRRRFTRPAEVSELATEMKSYAKTLTGSVWTLDRRRDEQAGVAVSTRPPSSARTVLPDGDARAVTSDEVLPLPTREAR